MKSEHRFFTLRVATILVATAMASPATAVQRAFVSAVAGDDGNVATSCAVSAPCRTFAQAATVVDAGGELVALSGGAYGAVTLTKSMALTAAPGIYAGISVFGGSRGVTIATPGVSVVLRGLSINGLGGDAGIYMTSGARLSVENCSISNFAGGDGIYVAAPAQVRVVETTVRNSGYGTRLLGGAGADIWRSGFFGNGYGVYVSGETATVTTVAVSDTMVSASTSAGIAVVGAVSSATARAELIRVAVVNGWGEGLYASGVSGSVASLTLGAVLASGNDTGVSQSGTAELKSLGNNAIVQNGVDIEGTLTPLEPR